MARSIAPTVSRKLRTAGFNVSPSARMNLHAGLFVTAMGDYATVMVDNVTTQKATVANIATTVREFAAYGDVEITTSEDGTTAWISFTYEKAAR